MQERLIELHQQRGRLLERIAVQRNTLSRQLAPLQGVLNIGDRVSDRAARLVQDGKGFVQRHPLAIAAAVAAVVVLKPRTVLRWTRRGLSVWRTWRSVQTLVPGFLLKQFRNLL